MRVWLVLSCLLLAACQTSNPYQTQSIALAPAPAVSFTPSGAPTPAPRPTSWAWHAQPLSIPGIEVAMLKQVISDSLDQYGLRPALQQPPTFLVSAQLEQRERIQRVYDEYPYGFGPHYYRPGPYGYGYPPPRLRVYRERIWQLHLALYDEASGQLHWRGTSEVVEPAYQPEQALYRAARRALQSYPGY